MTDANDLMDGGRVGPIKNSERRQDPIGLRKRNVLQPTRGYGGERCVQSSGPQRSCLPSERVHGSSDVRVPVPSLGDEHPEGKRCGRREFRSLKSQRVSVSRQRRVRYVGGSLHPLP